MLLSNRVRRLLHFGQVSAAQLASLFSAFSFCSSSFFDFNFSRSTRARVWPLDVPSPPPSPGGLHLCCELALCSVAPGPSSDGGASLDSVLGGADSGVLCSTRDLEGAPLLHWPAPDLPRCDRCGHDCSVTLATTPAEYATCPLCGFFPLSDFYSEVDAYDSGDGGRCLMCGCVQTPLAPQCLGCGGLVLAAHTEYYGAFGGYRSRELLVAIGRSLGALVPPSVFHDLLLYGGLDSWEAKPIVASYVRHCRGRFGFARGCSIAYLVAVGYSLG